MLGRDTCRILSLALRLPLGNLELLARKLALVVLVVVEIGVMGLDAVEEQVACLLEEGVDRQVQGIKRRVRGDLGRVPANVVERGRQGKLRVLGRGRDLVDKRREEVGIVDDDGDFGENILEGELRFLESAR